MPKYDLVVLGSGFGGYPAAIIASQKGLRVAVVEERESLGESVPTMRASPSKQCSIALMRS